MSDDARYWLASPALEGGRVQLPFSGVRVDERRVFTALLDLDGLDEAALDAVREVLSPDARFEIEERGVVIYRARILAHELRAGKPLAIAGPAL